MPCVTLTGWQSESKVDQQLGRKCTSVYSRDRQLPWIKMGDRSSSGNCAGRSTTRLPALARTHDPGVAPQHTNLDNLPSEPQPRTRPSPPRERAARTRRRRVRRVRVSAIDVASAMHSQIRAQSAFFVAPVVFALLRDVRTSPRRQRCGVLGAAPHRVVMFVEPVPATTPAGERHAGGQSYCHLRLFSPMRVTRHSLVTAVNMCRRRVSAGKAEAQAGPVGAGCPLSVRAIPDLRADAVEISHDR